jgi:hypothetical protein
MHNERSPTPHERILLNVLMCNAAACLSSAQLKPSRTPSSHSALAVRANALSNAPLPPGKYSKHLLLTILLQSTLCTCTYCDDTHSSIHNEVNRRNTEVQNLLRIAPV